MNKQSLFKEQAARVLGHQVEDLGDCELRGDAAVVRVKRERVTQYFAQRDAITGMYKLFNALPEVDTLTVVTRHKEGTVWLHKGRAEFMLAWQQTLDMPLTSHFSDNVKAYTEAFCFTGKRMPSAFARALHNLAAWVRRQRGK